MVEDHYPGSLLDADLPLFLFFASLLIHKKSSLLWGSTAPRDAWLSRVFISCLKHALHGTERDISYVSTRLTIASFWIFLVFLRSGPLSPLPWDLLRNPLRKPATSLLIALR